MTKPREAKGWKVGCCVDPACKHACLELTDSNGKTFAVAELSIDHMVQIVQAFMVAGEQIKARCAADRRLPNGVTLQ
jgi:hypothetical protein